LQQAPEDAPNRDYLIILKIADPRREILMHKGTHFIDVNKDIDIVELFEKVGLDVQKDWHYEIMVEPSSN